MLSFDSAVKPATPASEPAMDPTVGWTMSDRSAASACYDVLSVPLPEIGIAMLATVASSLTSTMIG